VNEETKQNTEVTKKSKTKKTKVEPNFNECKVLAQVFA